MTNVKKAVGIDIGGTKIAVAAVEQDGQIVAQAVIPTDAQRGFDHAARRIVATVEQVIDKAAWSRKDLSGIGIGCAGAVDSKRGTIHNPYTLHGWNNCDIASPLHKAFGVDIYLENDADTAVLGEWIAGAGQGFNRIVMLTLGTGVGSGVLVDGRIYRGAGGEHPELGHIPIEPDGPTCYWGTKGCLEAITSGTAISKAGRTAGFEDSRHVFKMAACGNESAKRIVERAMRAIVAATWTILHTFLPECIILGGGIADEHYGLFEVPVEETIAAAELVFGRDRITVAKAALGNYAGVIGAAGLDSRYSA